MMAAIAEVESVPAGVLIICENGRSAIYSATILYDLLPNAQRLASEHELGSETDG
jgi:hypothetical protein